MGTVSRIRKKPGPPPGTHHAGTFKKGPDSRRYKHDEGRRQARLQLEELCKELTPKAMETLQGLLESPNEKVRLEALTQVLDRGWGKPVDRVAIAQVGEGQSIQDMDLDSLIQRADSLLPHLEKDIVEGEFTEE